MIFVGYTTLRRLVKLEVIQFLLGNHGAENFPFLNQVKDTRLRSKYYEALGRLIGSDVSDDNTALFERFLVPLDAVLTNVSSLVDSVGHLPARLDVKVFIFKFLCL